MMPLPMNCRSICRFGVQKKSLSRHPRKSTHRVTGKWMKMEKTHGQLIDMILQEGLGT